ncbi:hypothetical protein MK139_11940, partial [bacterium]|nr:hypothetical protein [bacterium]
WIDAICRYPLAAHIKDHLRSTFADSSHGYIPLRAAQIINEHKELPELYNLCEAHRDRTLKPGSPHELATYTGYKQIGKADPKDYFLPGLGQVKMRSKPGRKSLTLMAIAGHNGVPHNHNDIGSFILHRGASSGLPTLVGRSIHARPSGPIDMTSFSAILADTLCRSSTGNCSSQVPNIVAK